MSRHSTRQRAVTTSRTGGQASTFALFALAAAVGGWWFWRRRKDSDQDEKPRPKKPQARGGRSAFKFPAAAKSSSGGVAAPTLTLPSSRAGGAKVGNPKKANKKQRKLEKQAKKEAKGAGLELVHNAQLGSSSSKKQEEEGPVTVKYVDLSKTADIYDKVREYQETGKKRYP